MITLITPVMNRVDLTYQFLSQHWLFYQARPSFDFVVVNNGSTDGTKEILITWRQIMLDRLTVINNPENRGFAAACNQGAARAKGEYLIFVNNDVILHGDYALPMVRYLESHPKSLVGAQVNDFDIGWNRFGDQLIPYIPAWCFGIKAIDFHSLGGFDERYSPADYEDMDLCYHAVISGYSLSRIDLSVQHLGGQTGLQLKDREEITKRNRQKFAKKWGLKC